MLDPFFDHVPFSFKAGCPSDLDCAARAAALPAGCRATRRRSTIWPRTSSASARRCWISRRCATRHWQERSEADFGVMFLEALSAVADDLSYTQDRVAAEATLMTATQRRSVVRHARLVDYEPTPPVVGQRPAAVRRRAGRHQHPARAGGHRARAGRHADHLRDRRRACATRRSPPPASCAAGTGSALERRSPALLVRRQRARACRPARPQMYVLGRGYDFQPGQRLLIETAGENPGRSADPPDRAPARRGRSGGPPVKETCDDAASRGRSAPAARPS